MGNFTINANFFVEKLAVKLDPDPKKNCFRSTTLMPVDFLPIAKKKTHQADVGRVLYYYFKITNFLTQVFLYLK